MSAIVVHNGLVLVSATEGPLRSVQAKVIVSSATRAGTRRIGAWEARLISETVLPG